MLSTCTVNALGRTMWPLRGSLNRLPVVFLCTLSHSIIAPLIASKGSKQPCVSIVRLIYCFTYKVNAASGDPRWATCCLFHGSQSSNSESELVYQLFFCLVLIYVVYESTCFQVFISAFHNFVLLFIWKITNSFSRKFGAFSNM